MSINDHWASGDWNVILSTNGTSVTYKIDTGAQVNVLPKKLFYSLSNSPKLKPTAIKLSIQWVKYPRNWKMHCQHEAQE